MKRVTLSGGLSALVLFAGLAAMPAGATTPNTAASPTPDRPGTERATAPYLIKVGDKECPVIPKGSSLSQNTQRLFETLTNACLMRASGIMTDTEFEQIRDQVVDILSMQMSADWAEAATASAQPPAPPTPQPQASGDTGCDTSQRWQPGYAPTACATTDRP
jgi:hypothetical protein